MQFNRQPVVAPETNSRYRQPQDRDIEELRNRGRRQFLVSASALTGGTALLLGGATWVSQQSFKGLFGSSPTTCTNTTTAKLSPSNPAKLTVCQGSNSIAFFPVYVAQQLGYFKAQGLNIASPAIVNTGANVVAAVQANKYQIGNGLITDAFSWSRSDSAARVIGAFVNAYTVDIVVSNQFEATMGVTASSSLADKVKSLKGKTIGITGPGSATQGLLTYLFRQQGMNAATDTKQVSLGSSNAKALAALKNGTVDALSFLPPIGQLVETQGVGDILISPMRGDIPGLVGEVHAVMYTKQSTIDANPLAIAAYIRAAGQAEAFIQSNPAEAKQFLNKYLNLGQAVTDAMYAAAAPDIAKTPQITQASYNIAGQFHVQAGLVNLIPSYNLLVATSTINSALGIGQAGCQPS